MKSLLIFIKGQEQQKKKRIKLFILLFPFLVNSCITIVPPRAQSDQHERCVAYENNPGQFSLKFRKVESLELVGELEDTTFVAVVAPWCPHCHLALKDNKYGKLNSPYKWIFIIPGYYLREMDKITRNGFPADVIYIPDHGKYGSEETVRMKEFLKEFTRLPDSLISPGVPQHFIYSGSTWKPLGPDLNYFEWFQEENSP